MRGTILLALFLAAATATGQTPAAPEVLTGTLEVLVFDNLNRTSDVRHSLITSDGKRVRLKVRPEHVGRHKTGDRVRARGKRTAPAELTLTAPLEDVMLGLTATTGAQRLAVILVSLDDRVQTLTSAQAIAVVGQTNLKYLESSRGLMSVAADVFGPFPSSASAAGCDYPTIQADARAAAAAAGVNLALYQHQVYVFPQASCVWWGLGSIGGNPSSAWITGQLAEQVLSHEFGHNVGMYHSHSMDCLTGACTTVEYGDYACTMGQYDMDFNPFQQERLGWLTPTTAALGGAYTLSPFAGSSGIRALKISGTPAVYVALRETGQFDRGPVVYVHTGDLTNGNTSYLRRLTAAWSLATGIAYTLPNGMSLTVDSVSTSAASVRVTAGNGPTPVATVVPATPTAAATPTHTKRPTHRPHNTRVPQPTRTPAP